VDDFDELDKALGLSKPADVSELLADEPEDDPFASLGGQFGSKANQVATQAQGGPPSKDRRPDGKSKNASRSTKPTGEKPTHEEYERRIEIAQQMLGQLTPKHLIKQYFNRQYGVSARTTEGYLARARARALEVAGETKQNLVAQSLALYRSVIASQKSSMGEKLTAQAHIDRLMGLSAVQRVEVDVNIDAPPMVFEVMVETREDVEMFTTAKQLMDAAHVAAKQIANDKAKAIDVTVTDPQAAPKPPDDYSDLEDDDDNFETDDEPAEELDDGIT
jgi:hypothetical protein